MPLRKPFRWWRLPLYVLLGLAVLVALLFVALRTSFAREQVRTQVNGVLAELFQGRVVIDRLGGLGLWGTSGVDARAFDANGAQVIRAQGLSAELSVPRLVWQLVANGDRPELRIARIHVDHAEVTLREDEELGVTLASAFLPRDTSEPEAVTPPGDGVRLYLERVTFGSVWAHGRASGSPHLDAELHDLLANLAQTPVDGLTLELSEVTLVSRGLPTGADPSGRVTGLIQSPAEETAPLRLEVTLDGRAAGSPLALEASWVGDDVHALVYAPRVPAAFVNQQVPGLALEGDVTVSADVDGPLPQLDFWLEVDASAAHLTTAGYAVVAQGMELGATVQVTRANVARAMADGPDSDLSLRANVLLLERGDEQFGGAYRVDVEPGRLQAEVTPALWLAGRAALDSEGRVETTGKLGADESGAALLGSYSVVLPSEGEGRVAASLEARLDDPARLARLGVRVAGTVAVSGELRPVSGVIAAKASASLGRVEQGKLQLRHVELRAQASGTLEAPRAHAAVTVDALSGRAHADLDYGPQGERLELFLADIDLLRLAHLLELEVPVRQATLAFDATLTRPASARSYALDATGEVDFGKLGSVSLLAKQLQLPQSAPTLARLGTLQGELSARGKFDLEALTPLLAEAGVPIERVGGKLRFEVAAKHLPNEPRGLELSAMLDTNAFRIVQKREAPGEIKTTTDATAAEPLAIEGIDLRFAARTWPSSGEVVATAILRDRGGTLLETQAELQLAELWPHGLTNLDALSRAPLRATFEVPRRRLPRLPPLVRPPGLLGQGALTASMEGSAADPRVRAHLALTSLRASGSRAPVDLGADFSYSPGGGEARVDAKLTRSGVAVATVETDWEGDLRRAFDPRSGETGLSGSAKVALREFPLDVVPMLVDRQFNGRISGDIELVDWGKNASVEAKLSSTTLTVGQIAISKLEVLARTDADKLVAELGLSVGSGYSKATLDAGMRWGKRPLPELEHRGVLRLQTRAFQLETLSPLLGGVVSELAGVLDANTEIAVTPDSTTLSGSAKLEQGVVQLPALGQRFSDISARVAVADNQFKLVHLEARGTTGRVTAKGSARLDGFELRGADAQLRIAEDEALPLTLEGAAIGDAWGSIDATFSSPPKDERRLDIVVPDFHLVTPETGGGSLQSLDANQDIRVGVRRKDGKFAELPVQPLEPDESESEASAEPPQPLRVTVKLGSKVVVERGRTARAQLTGQLVVLVADETQVDGRIELRGGKLDVQGKTFEIERGVITFDGNDPGNPTITATARWDAPGYTVYADYLGDVENGRIKLHSEPPLTASEIASLLLFGSPDGALGASTGTNNASLAVSAVGDTAAQGLNQVLDDFTNLDVSARIDTTTGSARPELVFQVSPRVAAKVTRAIGTPQIGESPDRTFLTLELRLRRAWALSALLGDRGATALDLIWRKRY
jgi:autotransporter translocation and assembly factor TamB